MTNTAFGLRCGLSEATVRSYVTQKSDPTLGKMRQIAAACGVTVGWLAGEGSEEYKNGELVAKIEPGNDKQWTRIRDNATRPTVSKPLLRWVVEWMDEEYNNDLGQEFFLINELSKYPSFKMFIEKKQPSKDHPDGSLESKSANGS